MTRSSFAFRPPLGDCHACSTNDPSGDAISEHFGEREQTCVALPVPDEMEAQKEEPSSLLGSLVPCAEGQNMVADLWASN